MEEIKQPSAGAGKQSAEDQRRKEAGHKESDEESCRCKEAAKKTPLDLLKLMVNDLAFWKK